MKATLPLKLAATHSLSQRTIAQWRLALDWDLHERRPYVVVDPVDNAGLLYLSARDYQQMVRTCLSTGDELIVVARPGDAPPQSAAAPEEVVYPSEDNSPFKNKRVTRRSQRWVLARSILGGLSRGLRRQVRDSMIEPTERNLSPLLSQWLMQLIHWTGQSRRSHHFYNGRLMTNYLLRVLKKEGPKILILRMKISFLVVYKYLGNEKLKDTQDLGHRISLRNGLPGWLPLHYRQVLRARNTSWIRIITSILFSYKVLKGPYGSVDYSTITAPRFDDAKALRVFQDFVPKFWEKIRERKEIGFRSELDLRPKFFHFSVSAGPNGHPAVLHSFTDLVAWLKQPSPLPLEWMKSVGDELGARVWKSALIGASHILPNYSVVPEEPVLGKLATKYEAAGKIRVFAIMDYWTQHCLKPLHQWMFKLLRAIPTDATFDQAEGVKTLAQKGYKSYWCFDLKSATDLIPLQLYEELLRPILGSYLVSLWSKLMTQRSFAPPSSEKGSPHVYYTRGQPMGAYSSWASLALVHHAIVQLSYHSITPGLGKENWFLDYRVLGDDIVIADKAVADAYLGYCALFGIPISPAKGIVSDQGLLNFASQFVQDSLDLSPASLKEELQISSVARRKEMASRLIRRGWARNSLAATLRLMLCPRIWDASMARLAKGKMSFALDMVIRSAFSPKASIIRYFGDSALLVRCWFRALRPGVGILTDLVEMSRGNEERRLSVLPFSEAERLMISKLASLIHADVLSQAERFETDMTQWELNVRPSVGDTYGMHVAYTTWFAFNRHRFAPMRERLDTVLQRANLTAAFLLDLPERVSPKDAIDRLMVLVDCSTDVPSLPRWSSPCPGATEAELYKAQTPEAAFRIACNMERQDWIRDLALLKLKEPHGDRSSYAQPSYFDSFEL